MSIPYRRQLVELAETLSAERHLLEQLLFKLVEARLVLAADEARFVPQAIGEVDAVIAKIRAGESLRTSTVARLADAMAEPRGKITLGYLASWAPEPYRTMFEDHRDQFQRLTTEIETAMLDNRRLASLAMDNVAASLGVLLGEQPMAVYDARGSRQETVFTGPTRIDEVF
jgi:FlgN protein